MESNNLVCKYHPSEQIQRICIDPSVQDVLYCVECILSVDKSLKNKLIPLGQFPQKMSELNKSEEN